MELDLAFLVLSILVFFSILLYHPARYYGVPALLIFMGIGVFLGNGGFDRFIYDFPDFTNTASALALNLIIFSGGFHTNIRRITPVMAEGLTLATVGVVITAILLGGFIYLVTALNLLTSLLLGAVVSSTDAAAVFSILEAKKLRLKGHTDTTIEFESATNDPMAMLLTLGITMMILTPSVSPLFFVLFFGKQVGIGVAAGLLVGLLAVWLLQHVNFEEKGLVPIFVMACMLIATLGGERLGGNRLIASYIMGLILGNREFAGKEQSRMFFNSTAWLSQVLMFLLLGLQVFPGELLQHLHVSLLPAIFLMLVARPVSVFFCMLFYRSPLNKKLFISWVGLKGASPIVFAFIPILQGVDNASDIFNMVFFVVLLSALIQGTTIGQCARWLKLEKDNAA